MTALPPAVGTCWMEDDDDTTGSTWRCSLPPRHAGDHETWIGGVLRYRWPRAWWESPSSEVRPRPRTLWRTVRRWFR